MFSKTGKKIVAFLLAVVMVFGVVPALDFGQEAEVEAAISPDVTGGEYTELTFSDFGIANGTVGGTSAATVVGSAYSGITATNGWDKIAISGFVIWPANSTSNDCFKFCGDTLRIYAADTNQWGFWDHTGTNKANGGKDEWWGFTSDLGIKVKGSTTLVRFEIDASGDDYVIKTYLNRKQVGTTTIKKGKLLLTTGVFQVGADANHSVYVRSYYEYGSPYTEMTFSDFDNFDINGTVSGGGLLYGANSYITANGLDKVALVGYLMYPIDGEVGGANILQIGALMALRMQDQNSTRMEVFDPENRSVHYWSQPIDASRTLEGRYVKIRLEFDVVNTNDINVEIFLNDESYGKFPIENGVNEFETWKALAIYAGANDEMKYMSYAGKDTSVVSGRTVTFHDFDKAYPDVTTDYLENQTFYKNSEKHSSGGHYLDYIQINGFGGIAFEGYVKWNWDGDKPTGFGNKVQFGNLLHYSVWDEHTIILGQPRTTEKYNFEWGRVQVPHVNLKNHYIKLRAEFVYNTQKADTGNENHYYYVKTYINDVWVGTTPMDVSNDIEYDGNGEVKQNFNTLWYRAMVIESAPGESISIMSYYDEYTFADFDIEDQLYEGTENLTKINDTLSNVNKTYDQFAFTGYIKPSETDGYALQFGNLARLNISENQLKLVHALDKDLWTNGTFELDEKIQGRWVLFRVEFDKEGTTYTARIYLDGERVGMATYDVSAVNINYFTFFVMGGSMLGVKSYPNYDEGLTPELTNTDFGLEDGTYTEASGQFAEGDASGNNVGSVTTVAGTTLDHKKFSANVTFGASGDALYVGATSATGTDGIAIVAVGNDITVAGKNISDANGKMITLDMELTDEDSDGILNDLSVGVSVDGKFKQDVVLKNYKSSFGSYLHAVGSSVKIGAVERTIDDSYDYRSLADVQQKSAESLGDTGNTLEDGMAVTGNLYGVMGDDVDHAAYGNIVKPLSEGCYYWTLCYGADATLNGSLTHGVKIGVQCPDYADGNRNAEITVSYSHSSDSDKLFDDYWVLEAGKVDWTQEHKIEITTDYVDADVDGFVDDVQLGVWLNGKLAENKYLFLMDCVKHMGKGVYYAGQTDKSYLIYQVMEKDLFAETYELNLEPNGYQLPKHEKVTIDNTYDKSAETETYENPVNKTYKTIGTFDTTHQSHGSVYNKEVTITMLSDANMNSVFDLADLVHMKKMVDKKVSYSTEDDIQMANADMDKSGTITTDDTQDIRDIILRRTTAREILEARETKTKVAVMSDTHLRADGLNDTQRRYNYKEALEYYRDQRVEAIVMNGDISDLGEEQSYQRLEDIFNEVYYEEYTYKDFGIADQQAVGTTVATSISGTNAAILSKLSLDRVAISGYITYDEGSPNGGGGFRVGRILAIRAENDRSIRIGTNISADGGLGSEVKLGVIDMGRDFKGEKVKYRAEFDLAEDGINYNVKIYVDDVYKDEFLLGWPQSKAVKDTTGNEILGSVELFKKDTHFYGTASAGEKVDIASVTENDRPEVLANADNHEYYPAWWWQHRVSAADYAKLSATDQAKYTEYTTNSSGAIDYYYESGWQEKGNSSLTALRNTKNVFRNGLTSLIGLDKYEASRTSEPGMNIHTVVNGYHIISVSADEMYGGLSGYYSETRTWLEEQLAEAKAADPTKPIFVAVHQPPMNTVVTSEYRGDGNPGFFYDISIDQVATNRWIFAEYPQAIVFGSHTHSPLTDEKSIWQATFTVINTASTYYVSGTEYTKQNAAAADKVSYANDLKDKYMFSQGLLLEIEGSKTNVKRIDFWNTESAGEDWMIDASKGSGGYQYTAAKQKETSDITDAKFVDEVMDIQYTSQTSVNVMFDAAEIKETSEQAVHRYVLTVSKGSDVVQTVNVRSYHYLGKENMPEEFVIPVTGLEAGQKYNFKIVAEDTYGTQSEPIYGSTYSYHY